MKKYTNLTDPEIIVSLNNYAIGVLPTDTLYGLVGKALAAHVVNRMYELKGRDLSKPFIILISSLEDIETFGIRLNSSIKTYLENTWPCALSVILPCPKPEFEYLHRGTNSLCFRMPEKPELLEIISHVGPLVAPSANTEGVKPASTIEEANEYFGEEVEFYVDQGELLGDPSTVVSYDGNAYTVVRDGAFHFGKNERYRAAAIVTDGSKVLLMHRFKKGVEYYVFPGGKSEEFDATPEAAMKRELKEETTLIAHQTKLVLKKHNNDSHMGEYYFLVTDFEGEAELSGEEKERMNENNTYELMWIEIEAVLNLENLFVGDAHDEIVEVLKANS